MRNRTLRAHGASATAHEEGLVTNHGPRKARTRRELARLVSNVRKVLRRTPTSLWLWVDRDIRQAKANGSPWFSRATIDTGNYKGVSWGMGSRALLILKGRAPACP